MEKQILLKMIFGKDQIESVDHLLEQFVQNAEVIDYTHQPSVDTDHETYTIVFVGAYSIYKFGHAHASARLFPTQNSLQGYFKSLQDGI